MVVMSGYDFIKEFMIKRTFKLSDEETAKETVSISIP